MTSHPAAMDSEWDTFLASCPHGYHEQSSLYASLRGAYGFHTARTVVRADDGAIIGGVQILYRKTLAGRLGLVLRGPVAKDDDPEIYNRVIAEMNTLARRKMLASLRVELFPTQMALWHLLESDGYRPSTAWAEEEPSAYADLTLDDDGILANLHYTTRNQVRGARRKGVEVTVGGKELVPTLHEMLQRTAEYQEFPLFPVEYFTYLHDVFGANRVPVFIARYEDTPVAAIMNFVTGNRMYYTWGGMDRVPMHRKLNVNRFLHYEAMRWGHAQGLDMYDLTGTTFFKSQLSHGAAPWPRVLRRHFGPVHFLHRSLVERFGHDARLRGLAGRVAHRLGYSRQMPY